MINNGTSELPYKDYGTFLREKFPFKVQKIAVNAGFACPNRDGTIGEGGCSYCNNSSFSPGYCEPGLSVTEQLEQGKRFFARKYPQMKYLAYFQAYTNTYAGINRLIDLYEEALRVEDVVGLIIATRPDCVTDELLNYLSKLANRTFVMVEYGVESSHDSTLKTINRGHTWQQAVDAINATSAAGIPVGAHLILGLPGESIDDILTTAQRIAQLPLSTVKLHQLQIIKGTRIADEWAAGGLDIINWTAEEYIDVCIRFIRLLPGNMAIERFVSQAPDGLLLHPRWGLKNYQFTNLVNNKLKEIFNPK